MRLRADWLSNAYAVPYIPTLGPVHPDACAVELFTAILTTPRGQFLPYDKDQRWTDRKDDTGLPAHVTHGAEHTTIATASRRRGGRVALYHYGTRPDLSTARELAGRLATSCGAVIGRVVWFHDQAVDTPGCTRVLLSETAAHERDAGCAVRDLGACPPQVQLTFPAFAHAVGGRLAFMARRWTTGAVHDPILVAVEARHVVGAIGPMRTWNGPTGVKQLLPQYFAVLPDKRQRGYGRALWHAAQRWGHQHDAAYQLLQAVAGGPADQLYRNAGARSLGLVHTVPA